MEVRRRVTRVSIGRRKGGGERRKTEEREIKKTGREIIV